MLRDLDLKHVYDSADHDLIHDLIVPLLSESKEYWRGVGYFTSGWLKNSCEGILEFVKNQGKARIVTSPLLQESDWIALQTGDAAKKDTALHDVLRSHVDNLRVSLSQDTMNALAWLVADDFLEFRFAIPQDFSTRGDYHDKVGFFLDSAGNMVAIHGSFNDTAKGSLNGEAFSVFLSWVEGQLPYVEQHRTRLQKLWSEGTPQFSVLPIPDAIRDRIVQLRTFERPYQHDQSACESTLEFTIAKSNEIELRPYQREAIDAWKSANYRGIFEMATGTGKTFTALTAVAELVESSSPLAIIILVPYLHLLEQWRKHCEAFGLFPVLCSGNHGNWASEVRVVAQDFRLGVLNSMCILSVHQTASTTRFIQACNQLPSDRTVLIADEVHGLGAKQLRKALLDNVEKRLGLSATPHRWYDEEGTSVLFNYFSDVCFEFPLEKAIGTFLTPYSYFPVLTELTRAECDEYEQLSHRIAIASANTSETDQEGQQRLKTLLIQRSRLISAAENKLPRLLDLIAERMTNCEEAGTEVSHVLVYCAPGTHKEVLKSISGLGLRSHEFVHSVSMRLREDVLKQFAEGDIQVLVAIHCLDEGVDIPVTRTAYFMASTTNPKEFIQRRGRILRKHPGKIRADVYDFIVFPSVQPGSIQSDSDKAILRREMPRFAEFAANASNEFEARAVVRDILDQYEMLYLLDEKPWDIYNEAKRDLFFGNRSL